MMGKVKTWVQMVAVAMLLLAKPEQELLTTAGICGYLCRCTMTLWSMVHYLVPLGLN